MLDRTRFIEQCSAQYQELSALLPWMGSIRSESLARLKAIGLPAKNNEYWKYSAPEQYLFADSFPKRTIGQHWRSNAALNIDMQAHLSKDSSSEILPDGLTVVRFSDIASDANSRAILEQHFNNNLQNLSAQSRYAMGDINTSMLNDGILVHVREGVKVAPLLNIQLDGSGYQRLLVVLEADSSLTLLEQLPIDEGASSGLSHIVESVLAPRASLQHSRVQPVSAATDYALTSAQLGTSAYYNLNLYTLGATNRRHDINFQLMGDDSKVELNAALYADNSQAIETLVNMEHVGKRTVSQQIIRGIATTRARVSINGRIHIHPDAQQTDANLSNKNLLLDNTARINTKPELEIYADQVKCAHGATVGQISEEEVFYLRSRGIDPDTARHMIAQGFIQSCLIDSPFREYAEHLFKEAFTSWEQ
jgi:Fe-S cluster assembly protein SufD